MSISQNEDDLNQDQINDQNETLGDTQEVNIGPCIENILAQKEKSEGSEPIYYVKWAGLSYIHCSDVSESELEEIKDYIEEKYSDLDLDVHMGKQPVYSFLVGVE